MSRSTPRNNQISIVAHRLWCCIYLISIIYCMFIQHFYYGTSIHDLETFLYVDSYILKVVNLVLILSGSHQRDDNLCEKIAAFDKRLLAYVVEAKRDESLLSHGRYRALMRRGVGAIMVLLIVSTLLEVWYNNFQFMLWAISCLVYVLPNITFALCHLQYVAKLQLLRWRSQQINISLKQILSADDDVNVKNRWFVGVSSAKSYSVNTSLNEIRLLHLELNSLGKVLSKAFEYVLVTFFVTSVILVTIATFTIYIVIYNWDRNFKYILTIYPVMWGAIYMGQVVLFLYLNDRLNQECRMVIPIMYQHSISSTRRSMETLNIINKFSLQVLHEPRYQLACGVVRLDMSTVATIVSTLAAYLIILIQFDNSTRSAQP